MKYLRYTEKTNHWRKVKVVSYPSISSIGVKVIHEKNGRRSSFNIETAFATGFPHSPR